MTTMIKKIDVYGVIEFVAPWAIMVVMVATVV